MTFYKLVTYFQLLEKTVSRNTMVEILSKLFKEASSADIDKICYLLQGRVAPRFRAIEFGLADKMMIRAIARGLEISVSEVGKEFKARGDLGETVEKMKQKLSKEEKLSIIHVYETLYQVAVAGGSGSQEEKIRLLGNLISSVDPLSAKYIVRIPLSKLRLGFSDMTILDSLSWMIKGSKELRPLIEKAYNVRPDLGFISKTVKESGMAAINRIKPKIGTPILMAKAERLSSGREIIAKIGKCALEPKYDGFRLQVHFSKSKIQNAKTKNTVENLELFGTKKIETVRLFTRNLEDVTAMYPDIVRGVCEQVTADEAIFEGEAIAYNPKTQEFLPFQETVQRKRKYQIEEKAREIPLKLFIFDLLHLNGESLLTQPYHKRRERLTQILRQGEMALLANSQVVDDPAKLESIFDEAVGQGLEGVIAKKIDGIYRAGARDWNWIKYKKSYAGRLSDTIDAVVMGYDSGQGKRTVFGIGNFLIGVFDDKSESFKTVAKIGTGLTDIEWRELKVKSQKSKVKDKPPDYDVDKLMACDVWVKPRIVVEIRADEITRSPVHTAGRVMKVSKSGAAHIVDISGFALRFPRLERFRPDKKPQDATTTRELKEMYNLQNKRS